MSLNNAQFSNVYSKPLKYTISEYHTTRCTAMHVFNASAGTYNAQRAGTIQFMLQFCNGLITRLMYMLWNVCKLRNWDWGPKVSILFSDQASKEEVTAYHSIGFKLSQIRNMCPVMVSLLTIS